MQIILEGPDNAGKSTLADVLAHHLGLAIIPGEGPGRSTQEINDRIRRYAGLEGIFDRHPCVSQLIYNRFRIGGPEVEQDLIDRFYNSRPIIIFCRGRYTLEGHVVKDHDKRVDASGTSHDQTVVNNHAAVCRAYEEWGLTHADLVYRIGDDIERLSRAVRALINRSFDPIEDIQRFHERFGLEYNGLPRALPKDLSDFRVAFMREEIDEYEAHSIVARRYQLAGDHKGYTDHLESQLDALVDEVYVVLGTAYLHGFNFRSAWNRVHAANMRKIRKLADDGTATDSGRAPTYDVVKPPGWVAPSHIDLVEVNDLSAR